jgi:protein SCO1/2
MTHALLALALASVDLQAVNVTEKLNQQVPLDLRFTDSTGREVELRELFGGDRPVILSLVYYRCPTLCSMLLGGLQSALDRTGLKLGRDYTLITASIDPSETWKMALEKQEALGAKPGWSFLVGAAPQLAALGDAIGFKSQYDPDLGQFAHAAGFVVLTPDGRVSRYVYGLEYPPRDVRLALVEAAGGKVGTTFDRFLLTCYRYDPATRRYGFVTRGIIQGGGLLVFFVLATFLGVLWRRERRR